MHITITNQSTGERVNISRNVCTSHPEWVHAQCKTSGEVELQRHLDQLTVGMWYDGEKHLGPDTCGMEMFLDEAEGEGSEAQ